MTNVKKEMPTMKTNNSQQKAVRRIPIRFRAFLFSAALIGIAIEISFGQPSFTAIGEIKVSQSPSRHSATQIAVQPSGACWIEWMTHSQFLHKDLTPDGQNTTALQYFYAPHAISDSAWGFIKDRELINDLWPIWTDRTHFYYHLSYDGSQIDSVSHLFTTYYYHYDNPGIYKFYQIISLSAQRSKNRIHLLSNYFQSYQYPGTQVHYSTRHRVLIYDVLSKNYITVDRDIIDRLFPFDIELNEYMLSPTHQDRIAILKRVRSNAMNVNGIDYPYHRSIRVYSSRGDSLSPRVVIDTISHSNADYAERVLLGDNNDVFLFRMHQPKSDSLFVLKALIDGSSKTQEKFLFHQVARSGLYANYEGGNLSRDRFIIVWTEVDTSRKRSQALCAVYDKNMNRISTVTRLSSDTSGSSFAISMALKGDSIYTAWIDTRNGEKHVYMRMFTPDQLTTTEPIAQPTAFGLRNIYPNPMRESSTIRFDISSSAKNIDLIIYDLLGREVRRLFHGRLPAGVHSIQFTREHLPSGMFNVVLLGSTKVNTKAIVLVK